MTTRASLFFGLILTGALTLAACGGSSGSSGDAPGQVRLDYHNSTLSRQTIYQYHDQYQYGPTRDFFHFVNEGAVILVTIPNDALEFRLSSSLHLFAPEETAAGIRQWINNQHADALYPNAPQPTLSLTLADDDKSPIESQTYVGREVWQQGDTYDRYDLIYTIDAYEHTQVQITEAFEAISPVAQHINPFSNILNTPLPVQENFQAISTPAFFSSDYKRLATAIPRFAPSLSDPNPAFYYPLVNDETLDENQLSIANGTLRISNAQFTVGQVMHRFPDTQVPNPKMDKTYSHNQTWGELDLSEPYRISFCVVSAGREEGSNAQFGIWLNLNVTDGIAEHGNQPRLFAIPADGLTSGARLTINVPGDITNSNVTTPTPIQQIAEHKGNNRSFLQFRVGSGGYLVMSDLVIERQDQDNAIGLTCNAAE